MPFQGNFSLSFTCTPFTALVALVDNMTKVENKVQRAQASASLVPYSPGAVFMKQDLLDTRCEESFPTCSLLLTALSLSKSNIQ